jgi:hypothetical protein
MSKRSKSSSMTDATDRNARLARLRTLCNVGEKTAPVLLSLGIETPEQMLAADPDALYEELKQRCGGRLDRCVLYQFRGAKYGLPWPECRDPFTSPQVGPAPT